MTGTWVRTEPFNNGTGANDIYPQSTAVGVVTDKGQVRRQMWAQHPWDLAASGHTVHAVLIIRRSFIESSEASWHMQGPDGEWSCAPGRGVAGW